ncbi:MAG: hypothetical protein ACFFCW_26950, partial [Candidatus Hodarchaeota archaeon]
ACPEFIPEVCSPDSKQGSECLLALEFTPENHSLGLQQGAGCRGRQSSFFVVPTEVEKFGTQNYMCTRVKTQANDSEIRNSSF